MTLPNIEPIPSLVIAPSLASFFYFLDQFRHRLRRLGAFLDPRLDLFSVEFDAAGFGAGIIGAYLLDVASVAREALVADNDPVKGFFLRPMPTHPNRYAHF